MEILDQSGQRYSSFEKPIPTIMKRITSITPVVIALFALALWGCDKKTSDELKQKADEAKETIQTKAKEAKDFSDKQIEKAKPKLEELKNKAKDAAKDAEPKLRELRDKAKDATQDAIDKTKDAADAAAQKLKEATQASPTPTP